MGIDATIPENIPAERYKRITYFNQGKVQLSDYLGDEKPSKPARQAGAAPDTLAARIETALLESHRFFAELLEMFSDSDYKTVAAAVARLYEAGRLTQDKDGKLELKSAPAR